MVYVMRRIIASVLTVIAFTSSLALSSGAASLPDYKDAVNEGVIVDLTDEGCLFDFELEELDSLLDDTAENVGFNVGIVITDNIPGADERSGYQEELVEDYANSCFDEMFGDDGILLVINYHTLYDYITADGTAAEYIGEAEVQDIFDEIELAMINYDTYSEIEGFANGVSFFASPDEDASTDTDISIGSSDNYGFFNIITSVISLILSILGW